MHNYTRDANIRQLLLNLKEITILGPSGEPWMVVEFMRFGDLADVLRTNSGVLSLQRSDSPVLEMVGFILLI